MGLVGPSGSGKSTAVRLILGVERPDDGDVCVLGVDPADFTADMRRRLGYLPQQDVLYGDLTLRHNLNLMASLQGMPWRGRFWPKRRAGRAARRRVGEVLDMLDLLDVRKTRLRDASGGEQRRLGLATALVHEPELLILDEPTAGLDPVLRQRLWDHFLQLREDGTTLLVTTQYIGEAAHCDLLVLLLDGRVLAADTPDALRHEAYGDDPDGAEWDDVFVRLVERQRRIEEREEVQS